jgi:hypothetical protein
VIDLLFSEADLAHVFLGTNPVAAVKQAIIKVNESLKLRFNPNHSPVGLLNEKAQFIDNLLTASWKHFLGDQANKQALIATGGYGRSELFSLGYRFKTRGQHPLRQRMCRACQSGSNHFHQLVRNAPD